MGDILANGRKKSLYDCVDCPAYCCSVYERVQVAPRDIRRLARHFGVTEEVATARFTKLYEKERILRRKKDPLFGESCHFLILKLAVALFTTRDRPPVALSLPPNAARITIC